jgi:crotonobetainyl-CoA:carnitine CoA-transferase CaiB-like acyl-CoA transferase
MVMPLEGIRILEWGVFHAGPGGPAILSELGAEVIKIEQPKTGDPIRQLKQYKDIDFSFSYDRSIFFEAANRGKKSITIDLSRDEGREIAYELVKKSDVFFTNLRLKTVEKMKMDYETLSGIKPEIIYATVSSYGQLGPDKDLGGFDYQGQGRSGFMFSIGEPGMPPMIAQFGIIDQSTAIMASYEIILALLIRERFGIGQKVDVSLLSTASYMMYINNLTALLKGREVPRHDPLTADPLRNYYQCKDGKWVVQNQQDKNWRRVCELIGRPELAEDPRYETREKRIEHSRHLVSIFREAFMEKTRDEWVRIFAENDLIMSPVNTTLEAIEDPQMIENGYIVEFDHPEVGRIRIPGFPIRFSNAKVNANLIAPRLGENTEEILTGLLGYSEEEVARLREEGIV